MENDTTRRKHVHPAGPSDAHWQQVVHALADRDPRALARLSTASRGLRNMAAPELNSKSHKTLMGSSAMKSPADLDPLSSKDLAAVRTLAKEAADLRREEQEGGEWGNSPVPPLWELVALALIRVRHDVLDIDEEDLFRYTRSDNEILAKLPAAWGAWNDVSPEDIVAFAKKYYGASSHKHPRHYETKFLLGLKAFSAQLTNHVAGRGQTNGKHSGSTTRAARFLAQAMTPPRMREAATNALSHDDSLADVADDLETPALPVVKAIYRASTALFRTPDDEASKDARMTLGGAITRATTSRQQYTNNGQHGLKIALELVHEADPPAEQSRKARLQVSAGIGRAMGMRTISDADELDALRVIYAAAIFMDAERTGRLAPDFRPEAVTREAFLDLEEAAERSHAAFYEQADVRTPRELFEAPGFVWKRHWVRLRVRAALMCKRVAADPAPLRYAKRLRDLESEIFSAPHAPMKDFGKYHPSSYNKGDAAKLSIHTYPLCLKATLLLFFEVLRLRAGGMNRPSLQPFPLNTWEQDYDAPENRPSKHNAYVQLESTLKRYKRNHANK